MPTPDRRDRFATVDDAEIHYSEWGDADGFPVVCVHGFSRHGRDFDDLAAALAGEDGYRVVCPDVPGRGLSEWSDDPAADYTAEALAASVVGLCEDLGLGSVHWVGTSMGGAMGIRVASGPLRDRIARLVLNDIGPGPVEDGGRREGGERIETYLRDPPALETLRELDDYFVEIYGRRGATGDVQDRTLHSARRTDDGRWTPNYDPDCVGVRFDAYEPRDLWDEWEAVDAPTLLLRGAESDVLSAAETEEMVARRPGTAVVEYPGVGHAPSLSRPEQIDEIAAFLAG